MVGFWKEICAVDRGLDRPGPGQPFPDLTRTKYTWPNEMAFPAGHDGHQEPTTELEEVIPQDVKVVWEPIEGGNSIRALTKPCYNLCFQGF